MKKILQRFCIVLMAAAVMLTGVHVSAFAVTESSSEEQTAEVTALLDSYGRLFGKIGTCINLEQLKDAATLKLVKEQYNSITLENEMKPDYLLRSYWPEFLSIEDAKQRGYYIPDSYKETTVPALHFSTVDEVLQICYENGLGLRGHTLVWHSQTPEWFFRINYDKEQDYVDAETMNARMEFYIRTVMGHICESPYGDVLYAWDVVNEYLNSPEEGFWNGVYGKRDSYVKKAFEYANAALEAYGKREQVELFCTDFNTYMNADKMIALVQYVNSEKHLCDGVGMQSHLGTDFPLEEWYLETVKKFIDSGFTVQIAELDIGNEGEQRQADYCYRIFNGLIDLQLQKQGITGLTLWGLADSVSWRKEQSPLLFSEPGVAKASYHRVMDAYKEREEELNAYYEKQEVKPTGTPEQTPSPTDTPEPEQTPSPTVTQIPEPTATPTQNPMNRPQHESHVGQTFVFGNLKYKVTKDDDGGREVRVTSLRKKVNTLTIPKTVANTQWKETFKVTSIKAKAFKGQTFKKVVIKANVTKIGPNAFKNCRKLKNAVLGKNVKSIGARAFFGCKNLKKVTIKSTVLESVKKNAFKRISKRAVIKVPESRKKVYKNLIKGKITRGVKIK